MPHVNLSTLNGPELRRLLDSTRRRGEAAMSYEILQEMAARREDPGRQGLFATRRRGEQRIIDVDLGDPLERDDELPPMPLWRPPEPEPELPAASPPQPAPRGSRRRKAPPEPTPASLADIVPPPPLAPDADPADDAAAGADGWDLRFPPAGFEAPPAPPRPRRGLAAGFAVGAVAGVALGWWAGGIAREAPPPRSAQGALSIETAALASPPAPALAPEPRPAPEALPAQVAPPSEPGEAALAAPNAPQVARDAAAEATEPPPASAPREAEPVRTAEAEACATEPTPADRTICGDPELRRLQRELRQAYTQALEAHEDRALLRQRQLAWASARDTVAESGPLAQLYEARIRRLNAATEAARQQR